MTRPWMPLYVADYLADTAHLDAAESGAYLHLIMHYWQNGELPAEDRHLARIAKMTDRQWKAARDTIAAFFSDGWKHKRIEFELTEAARISAAGRTGGKASAEARRSRNDNATTVERPLNDSTNDPPNDPPTNSQALPSPSQRKKDSEPNGSDAGASPEQRDIRAELFRKGLQILQNITGKTPDSCRSLIGKWLKSINDEAIHVLGAIEEAERNRIADPVPWITRALVRHAGNRNGKRTVQEASHDLVERIRNLGDVPTVESGRAGKAPVRLLSTG